MRLLRRLLLLGLIIYVLTGITQVEPEEQAVVRRFGEPVARWGPGLHYALPWGMDRVDRVRVSSVRQVMVGYPPDTDYADAGPTPPGQLLSADENLVNLQLAVTYNVGLGEGELERYVVQENRVEALLLRVSESLAAEWVAGRVVDDVLLAGSSEMPQWMMRELPARLAEYQLGIQVQQVSVAYLAPPDEVKAAFEAVNRAESQKLTQENQARQEASQRLRQAQAEENRQRQLAEGYRQEQLALARADAEAFTKRLDQYRTLRETNPAILTAIWWDEMGKVLLGMNQRGRIDLLDNHLGTDGLDITQFIPPGRR